MPDRLDGNVLAGVLSEIFDFDTTSATGRCVRCDDVSVIALAVVEASKGGLSVRCHRCGGELLLAVEEAERLVVTVSGLRDIRSPA